MFISVEVCARSAFRLSTRRWRERRQRVEVPPKHMNKVGNEINYIGTALMEVDYSRARTLRSVRRAVLDVLFIAAALVVWGAIWFASM
jgi:hypothetical protein